MKAEIRNCLIWYANRVSETVQYANWSDDFCRKEIRDANDIFVKNLKRYIDFNNLTEKQARELGFQKWREEPDFYLIPLYLLPVLPIGTEVTCVNGEKIIYDGHNIDNDIRCGCIAYGIHIPEPKQEKRYVYMLRYDDDWEEAHFSFGIFDSEDKAKAEMENRLEDSDNAVMRAERRKHYSIWKIEVK